MIHEIPSADELRTVIGQKRNLKTAADGTGNPDLSRNNLYILLRVILEQLTKARNDPFFVDDNIVIAIESTSLNRAIFTQITDILTDKGYTTTPNIQEGTLTISW